VISPFVLQQKNLSKNDIVLDIGCGTGHLTCKIAEKVTKILGIDISKKMIAISNELSKNINNSTFLQMEIEKLCQLSQYQEMFSLCFANMSLMTIKNLDGALKAINDILVMNGKFIFIITHPCFWPIYKNYSALDGFNYYNSQAIQEAFTITNDRKNCFESIVFHRSLHVYTQAILNMGFTIVSIDEPLPPRNLKWEYPHFLAFTCIKTENI